MFTALLVILVALAVEGLRTALVSPVSGEAICLFGIAFLSGIVAGVATLRSLKK